MAAALANDFRTIEAVGGPATARNLPKLRVRRRSDFGACSAPFRNAGSAATGLVFLEKLTAVAAAPSNGGPGGAPGPP